MLHPRLNLDSGSNDIRFAGLMKGEDMLNHMTVFKAAMVPSQKDNLYVTSTANRQVQDPVPLPTPTEMHPRSK